MNAPILYNIARTQSPESLAGPAPFFMWQELGYRGSDETLKRDEFEARKKAAEVARINKLRAAPKQLASANKDVTGFAFLASLAEREEMVRNGKLTVPSPPVRTHTCASTARSIVGIHAATHTSIHPPTGESAVRLCCPLSAMCFCVPT